MLDINPEPRNILIAYNVLAVTSFVLIILILLPPLFCKTVHRRLPWYSHMLAWLIVSVTLLLTIGHQKDDEPPADLCFIQTALLYATPPLISFSMACHLLDLNLALNTLLNKKSLRERNIEMSVILAFLPWIIFWAVLIEVSVAFVTESGKFTRSDTLELHSLCHYHSKTTDVITISLFLTAVALTFFTKGWTIVLLIRKFRTYEWSSREVSQMVLSSFIRSLVFLGIAVIAIVLGQVSLSSKSQEVGLTLALPSLPIIAALMYGVHVDTIRCLLFWKKSSVAQDLEKQNPPVPPKSYSKHSIENGYPRSSISYLQQHERQLHS